MSEQSVQILLADAGTVTIVTGAAAWVIDKKTGKVIKVVPEMPGWERNLETMTAVASFLNGPEGKKGGEALELPAIDLILALLPRKLLIDFPLTEKVWILIWMPIGELWINKKTKEHKFIPMSEVVEAWPYGEIVTPVTKLLEATESVPGMGEVNLQVGKLILAIVDTKMNQALTQSA